MKKFGNFFTGLIVLLYVWLLVYCNPNSIKTWKSYGKDFIDQKRSIWYSNFSHIKVLVNA